MNAGNTKRETEQARAECEKLRTELRYEIDKIAASQRLDLNLEKARNRGAADPLNRQSSSLRVAVTGATALSCSGGLPSHAPGRGGGRQGPAAPALTCRRCRARLSSLQGRIRDELQTQNQRSMAVEVRLDKEVNAVRTALEANKNDIIRRGAAGRRTPCVALKGPTLCFHRVVSRGRGGGGQESIAERNTPCSPSLWFAGTASVPLSVLALSGLVC